jgi:hypothetical protein
MPSNGPVWCMLREWRSPYSPEGAVFRVSVYAAACLLPLTYEKRLFK